MHNSAHEQPLTEIDVIEHVGEPVTLAAGVQLRRTRCLLCGSLIGGRPARFAVAMPAGNPPCECGCIDSMAGLICAEHEPVVPGEVTHAMARLARRANESGHLCT